MKNGKSTTVLLVTAAMLLLVGSAVAAQKEGSERDRSGLVRLTSITENGTTVTLHLEDGRVLDVERSRVNITGHPGSAQAGGVTRREQRREMSLDHLSAMGEPLPAVVKVKYGHDGSIKRARVQVFASEAETRAFLDNRASRRAAMQSAKPNH